jgi:hypothetical protein
MLRRRFQIEKGAATVEFAIIAIIFFIIIFGIIEFGILMFDQHILTNASREAARAGIVMRVPRLSDAAIKAIITNYAQENMVTFGAANTLDFGPWPSEDPNVWILPTEADRVGGDLFGEKLTVKVKYQFDFLVLSIVGLGPIELKAETIMRME